MVKLYTYESLYANSIDQSEFVNTHETGTRKLQIFEQIHSEECSDDDETDSKPTCSECGEDEIEESGSTDSTDGDAQDSSDLENTSFCLSD